MKRLLAVVSDVHAGSTVGLCPPGPITLGEGGAYIPSKAQEWLHSCWLAFWSRVAEYRKHADWFGVLANGDLVDGDHHGTVQIVSRDPGVQSWMLKKLFAPVMELKPDSITIVRGTEAHVGKNAGTEETFARWLANEKHQPVTIDPDTGMYSWWQFQGDLGDLRISAAHHGRMGQRPWTKPNVVANLAAEIFYEYATLQQRWPDIAFRSHYHTYVDTYQMQPVRVVQTPAWQLHTAYAHKVVPEKLADIGGVILALEDGKAPIIEPIIFKPARPAVVALG